jgi:beta-glucosidase
VRRLATSLLITLVAGCSGSAPVPENGIHAADWPRVRVGLAHDAKEEARIDAVLQTLTIEQKVGQLIQADIGSIKPDDLRRYPLGSILNGGNSAPGGNEFAPPSDWLSLADAFYDASLAYAPNAIPVIWGTDAVHGHNNVVGATIFPHNIGLGAARDADLIRRIGEATALEVAVTGHDWTFAPTLAVVRDDRWGRTYESYSEDPAIVRAYATAMVEGLQGRAGTARFLGPGRTIATAKHFLGDGGTVGGKDQGDNRAAESELRDVHGAAYPAAIGAGVQTVMASFSSWQGAKLHGHRALITQVLKGRMGFDGVVVGDWNAHGQVPGCTNESCAQAYNAGIDVLMAPDSWKALYENTLAQAKSGVIPRERLDDAVRRMLRVKARAGLLERSRPSSRPFAGRYELLGGPSHRALAREAVRKSLVLLKNRDRLLPLSPRAHVLVAGAGADDIAQQCGGWTLTWQGTGVTNAQFSNGESIYAGIRAAVEAGGGTTELNAAGDFSRRPDVAIVVYGEQPYAEFQGDLQTLEFSPGDKRDLALLTKLKAHGVPVVSVFLTGRPLWVNPELNASDAFVVAWLPGSEGGGVADVLFRRPDGSAPHDFAGRLAFSWPRASMQTNLNRGDGDTALFAYGFGLRSADDGNLAALPETLDTRTAHVTDTKTFFVSGRPGSGWRWVADPADGRVRVTTTDHLAQEDARLVRWTGTGAGRAGIAGDAASDLRREANGELSLAFDYRVDQPPTSDVHVAIECGAGCAGAIPLTRELAAAPSGEWRHLKIRLSCFERAGADMQRVTAPFLVATEGQLAVAVARIRLESGTDGVLSCPN